MVNQLWNNIQWNQRSDFIGVPTDCPQRDERLGWTADARVLWRAAAYNMDLTGRRNLGWGFSRIELSRALIHFQWITTGWDSS